MSAPAFIEKDAPKKKRQKKNLPAHTPLPLCKLAGHHGYYLRESNPGPLERFLFGPYRVWVWNDGRHLESPSSATPPLPPGQTNLLVVLGNRALICPEETYLYLREEGQYLGARYGQ